MRRHSLILTVLASLLVSLAMNAGSSPKREFRATWLTTVWRIDWPSTAGTSSSVIATQKQELINYLDKLEAMNMNAVCLQVRSMCDAFYQSSYEPWSSYISGSRGTNPGWDPLAYAVEQAHARGLELHAWINPYRWATTSSGWSTSQDQQLKNAGMILTYTSGSSTTSILNPGLEASRQRIVNVCREIINNYEVDGIIFDDYFYPNGISTSSDAPDYSLWQSSGTSLSFANWRRANVNQMVADVWNMIQQTKPEVRFGIGPAGVAGTASTSASAHGVDPCPKGSDWQYNGIFSDPLAWLDEGTIDYISPQLYWKTTHSTNPFGPLTNWWSYVANHFGRHHYASHSISFLASEANSTTNWAEVASQIRLSRQYNLDSAPGANFYSAKNINGDNGGVGGLGDYLHSNVFQDKSILPAVTWKTATPHSAPENLELNNNTLTWTAQSGTLVKYSIYAIPESVTAAQAQGTDGIDNQYLLTLSYTNSYTIPAAYRSGYYFGVCVVDGFDNEYDPAYSNEAPPEPATKVTLTSPVRGATADWTTTFRWSAASNATFLIQISSNSSFSNILIQQSGITTNSVTLDLTSLSPTTRYYWRIITSQPDCTDTPSDAAYFTTTSVELDPATKVTLTTPIGGATVAWSTLFRWTAATNATYRIQVSTSDEFSSTVIDQNGITTNSVRLDLTSLEPTTRYYWRIITSQPDHLDTPSDAAYFTTGERPKAPVPQLVAPENEAEITDNFSFEFTSVDATCILEVATDAAFTNVVTSFSSFSTLASGNKIVACEASQLGLGTFYWRVRTSASGCDDSVSDTRSFEITSLPIGQYEAGYVIKKDIDDANYAAIDSVTFASKWFRSVKEEYNNLTFENAGLFNRGMAVSGNYLYVTGRTANSWDADIWLEVYDKNTGEHIRTLYLGSEAGVPFAPCNDVFTDAAGNLLISNLTLNITSTPLTIYQVNPDNGEVTERASFTVSAVDKGRVDHCNVLGDVSSGNFVVFAAQASGNVIFKATYTNGTLASTSVFWVDAFYPSDTESFGIAPRIYPVDDTHVYVKGAATHPTLYRLDGYIAYLQDSFANNTLLQPVGIEANGMTMFEFNGQNHLLYAYDDNNGYTGIRFLLAGATGSTSLRDYGELWTFPAQGIGDIYSQTWSAPCTAEVASDGKTADIYIYAAGNGIASYRLTRLQPEPQYPVGDVNHDGQVTVADVTAVYSIILGVSNEYRDWADVNGDGEVTVADVTAIYNVILGS